MKNNHLFLQKKLFDNVFKIIISSLFMASVLFYVLNKYSSYLEYTYSLKSVYLLVIVCLAVTVYLLSCYVFGLFKIKNYKTN